MQKPSYWSILTADVRYDRRLKANEKLLFSEITALSNKYGFCNANNSYFAKLYGKSNVSISTWINDLRYYGYLKIVMKNGLHKRSRRMYPLTNPLRKFNGTHKENFKGSHKENFKYNNTSTNKTSNNSKNKLASKIAKDFEVLMVQINDFVLEDINDMIKTYPSKLIFKAIYIVATRNPNPKYVVNDVWTQLRNGCQVNHYQPKKNKFSQRKTIKEPMSQCVKHHDDGSSQKTDPKLMKEIHKRLSRMNDYDKKHRM